MSYRLKRKKFKCITCKTSFAMLVQSDDQAVSCENCGKRGIEEEVKAEPSPLQTQQQFQARPPTNSGHAGNGGDEERKRYHLVDGAYRIVFNKGSAANQFHTRTNIRDRSIENIHGDANFQPQQSRRGNREDFDDVPPLEQVYRTPNPPKVNKVNPQSSGINSSNTQSSTFPRGRPPSGLIRQGGGGPQMSSQGTTFGSSSNQYSNTDSNLPRIDSQRGMRPPTSSQGGRGLGQTSQLNVPRQGANFQRPPSSSQQQSNYRAPNHNSQSQNYQQQANPRMTSQNPPPRQPNHQFGSGQQQQQRGQDSGNAGNRARSTTIRIGDGQFIQFIDLPMGDIMRTAAAAGNAAAGMGAQFSNFGMNSGPTVMNFNINAGGPNINTTGPNVFFMRRNGNNSNSHGQNSADANLQEEERMEFMLGNLMRGFSDLFSGHQFLRMGSLFSGFSPDQFMSNFQSNFASSTGANGGGQGGVDFFEMVRRMSEQEAEARARKKRAKSDAVTKLPVVKIEAKHCKKNGSEMEPPSCTVCCDAIALGSKGMFMPCGHIYHPDCLNPWLKEHNTCPVCRFELPTEEHA